LASTAHNNRLAPAFASLTPENLLRFAAQVASLEALDDILSDMFGYLKRSGLGGVILSAWLLVLSGVRPPFAEAQEGTEFGVGFGAAVPVGSAARYRSMGPGISLTAGVRISKWVIVDLDVTAVQLQIDSTASSGFTFDEGTLRLVGGFLRGRAGKWDSRVAQYGVLGIGRYWMNMAGTPNPYGVVWGATLGTGVTARLGNFSPFAEARIDLVASDFGADEWHPTVYLPVIVGVRWRL
jgi:hypothetical protein